MPKRNQHVVPHPDGWAVKPEGGKRASSVHDTQQEAIDRAREIARNQESKLFIHKRDGTIREHGSYGNDPFPQRNSKQGQDLHVLPHDDGWAVKHTGSNRTTSVYTTQQEAIEAARAIARKQGAELVIHSRDGRIRARDSYSSDPLPPKSPREVLFPKTKILTSKKAIRKVVTEVIRKSHATSKGQ